nr:photosystem II protein L [Prunus kansuensis]
MYLLFYFPIISLIKKKNIRILLSHSERYHLIIIYGCLCLEHDHLIKCGGK